MMLFIDWISAHQIHRDNRLPVVGTGRVIRTIFPSNELEDFMVYGMRGEKPVYEKITGKQIRSSYETGIMVSCDPQSGRVSVSGNPSRFGRLDNVFGFVGVVDAIEKVFNPILVSLGLPPFSLDARDSDLWQPNMDGGLSWVGCTLTRLDLTRNWGLGDDSDVVPFLQYLGTRNDRLKVHLFPDGYTVEWGGSAASGGRGTRFVYRKCYGKAYEMEQNLKRMKCKGASLSKEDSDYLSDLMAWVTKKGTVRFEVELKGKYLKRYGMNVPAYADMRAELAYDSYADRLMDVSGVEVTHMTNIPELLVGLKIGMRQGKVEIVSEAYANQLFAFYHQWTSGVNLREKLPRTSFFRARRLLLTGIGVDISKPANVISMPIRVRTFELRELEPPRWYRGVDQVVNE
ncbi:MAG: hypothetical protein HQL75_05925 [Magnetococcales bacterium]|nr:hypothetical protein [Magnetococcales bacterium]